MQENSQLPGNSLASMLMQRFLKCTSICMHAERAWRMSNLGLDLGPAGEYVAALLGGGRLPVARCGQRRLLEAAEHLEGGCAVRLRSRIQIRRQ